jgi:hypothetical protein
MPHQGAGQAANSCPARPQWREWTGLPFDITGDVIVPEALIPVHCDAEHDHAVYVEPNVWVEHALSDAGPGPARRANPGGLS